MAKFQFSDELPIEIPGYTFTIRVTNDLGKKLTIIRDKYSALAKSPDAKNMTEKDTLLLLKKDYEEFLGKGVYDNLFKNREENLRDATDFIYFVKTEIEKLAKRTINRQKSRHKKK